jgi:hypothetical protein
MRVLFLTCALAILPFLAVMAAREDYGTIKTTTNGSVVRASISNPPINLYDYKLATDLHNFLLLLNQTNAPKVVIFESADPQFFIAHYDVSSFLPPSTPEKSALVTIYIDTARPSSSDRSQGRRLMPATSCWCGWTCASLGQAPG